MHQPDLTNRHPVVPVATLTEIVYSKGCPQSICTSINDRSALYRGAMLYTAQQVDMIVKHRLDQQYSEVEERINAVYHERNLLAVALARLSIRSGLPAGAGFDPANGRSIVYVETESGAQLSWHMDDQISQVMASGAPGANKYELPDYTKPWDGTFKGREEDWPIKYIPAGPYEAQGHFDSVTGIKIKTDALGRSWACGIRLGDLDAPDQATHYRMDSANKRRYYYEDPVTGWHYYHADAEAWYPTDLGADYLTDHLRPVNPSAIESVRAAVKQAVFESDRFEIRDDADAGLVEALRRVVVRLGARVKALENQKAEARLENVERGLIKATKQLQKISDREKAASEAFEYAKQLGGGSADTSAILDGLASTIFDSKLAETLTKPLIILPEPDFSLKAQAVRALMKHLDGDASVPIAVAQATHICIRPEEGDVVLYSLDRNAKVPVCWLDRDTQCWKEAAVNPDWVIKNCLVILP